MTKLRYPQGCAAGSQECGIASSPSDNAWNVRFNNGNVNWNNQNNSGFVVGSRLVPAGEYQDAVSPRALRAAWRSARRKKRPSQNQVAWETQWADGLIDLEQELNAGVWAPAKPTCFITTKPKAREIHAPHFRDRVVHHLLVPTLEAIYERIFIHDSFSNRAGKGTHAAVNRLRDFVRQVQGGEGGGHYLQLDIRTFFNCINRPILWNQLKPQMVRANLPQWMQLATHALLRRPPLSQGVIYCATPAERALVPPHKRLENAAPGCGLPIGNLSSQFFANVYLNELDQFVKHVLKVKRYVRYVDDFVLVHKDRAQLEAWRVEIERFLADQLKLAVKSDVKLRPLSDGIDFLGYVLYPTHTRVRRRVLGHAREQLHIWEQANVRPGEIAATPAAFRHIVSVWRSHEGHLSHADSFRLRQKFHRRFPWLHTAMSRRRFHYSLEDCSVKVRLP